MSKRNALPTDFKIIAIKPLLGCKPDLLKVLKENQAYYFFNDYCLDEDDKITYECSYPTCLYDYRKTMINISAIAGKNGSGKSTISDLLFMAINNIAYYFKMKTDLVPVTGLKVALYIKIKILHKIVVDEESVSVFDYDTDGKLLDGENKMDTEFNRRSMFYTICMNYSHYAYNSNDYVGEDQEDWLDALFHKNDAYQTPLVINPWRDEGNIIINRENELVKSRLVANLLRESVDKTYDFRNITDNLRAKRLVLNVDQKKFYEKVLYKKKGENEKGDRFDIKVTYRYLQDLGHIKTDEILKKINTVFDFGYKTYKVQADELEDFAMHYLIRKLITVSIKYDEYNGYFNEDQSNFEYPKLSKFISLLVRDRSHIAFKFKQTLNYLRHKHISVEEGELTLDKISDAIKDVIAKKQTHKDKLIELIPPPIFTVDIILEPLKGEPKEIKFKSLSSGEKQMAYSMSSVLYHLINLDSVKVSTPSKIKYKCIQIVLEEIELYFHPEMQRKYVNFLRQSIIYLELTSIRNISICFVTHSPFILSDIPRANIMFLDLQNGQSVQVNKEQKTFAANIHNLLATGFFMTQGLCGEFAINQVNNTIWYLNTVIKLNEKRSQLEMDQLNEKLMDEVEDLENDVLNVNEKNHALLIRNVAEPVLASKLLEMYDKAFHQVKNEKIRAQIAFLQEQLLKN